MRFVYKIVCDDLPEYIYIGSTANMTKRKYQHKTQSKIKIIKLYTTIRENGGWDNWRMVLVEELGDVSKNEAVIREEHYRVEFQANLNSNRCHITKEQSKEHLKEYRETNKEHRKEYLKKNKEQIKEKQKEYREANKDKRKEYQKEYREANKEKKKEYNKIYREKKKEATD
tara:strand:- start:42 stop:554 length:513 start_codon:yes stop_codon:yes gene_type:complete